MTINNRQIEKIAMTHAMGPATPQPSASQAFANWALSLSIEMVPSSVRSTLDHMLLDVSGLCVAGRELNYVQAAANSWDASGPCTLIGHANPLEAAGAAFVNGTAAHGEDYDDTFEGTPVHTGAVIVPAVLATCERFGLSGSDALRGMAVGTELMCRMALVAPMAIHRAGFHPTAVIGAMGAAAAVATSLRLSSQQFVDALGVAGSLASGIIEYLAEGSWTKRIHAGWAAQNGLRAALIARQGFRGPRTVFEGKHGFFFAFADSSIEPDVDQITTNLGVTWHAANVAFKPYACGTMAQPFIDCALKIARRGIDLSQLAKISCDVGEGTVHRLWEPLSEKHRPSTAYSAKFSVPFCIAVALHDEAAGLSQFEDNRVQDLCILETAARVSYEINPHDEYPRNYSGHIRATFNDGQIIEERQPHLRGGVREPMSREELVAKFHANASFGGWPESRATDLERWCTSLFNAPDFSALTTFRG